MNPKEDSLLFKDIPAPSWKGGGGTLVREVLGGGGDKTFNKLGLGKRKRVEVKYIIEMGIGERERERERRKKREGEDDALNAPGEGGAVEPS
jgi:hypothetical protein